MTIITLRVQIKLPHHLNTSNPPEFGLNLASSYRQIFTIRLIRYALQVAKISSFAL